MRSTMIATVTLNPAIDKSVAVRGFEIGVTNRCDVERVDAGGKGINVARALKRLGSAACALGLAAATDGGFILRALDAEGIPADFVRVPGETRVNLKIHRPRPRYGNGAERTGVPSARRRLGGTAP